MVQVVANLAQEVQQRGERAVGASVDLQGGYGGYGGYGSDIQLPTFSGIPGECSMCFASFFACILCTIFTLLKYNATVVFT